MLKRCSLIDMSTFQPSSITSMSRTTTSSTSSSSSFSPGDISRGRASNLLVPMDKKDGICHQERTLTVQICIFPVSYVVQVKILSFTNRILVMAFVTYILLSTTIAGLRGAFQPELLGYTASTAFGILFFEILCLKLGTYLLSISNESQLLDLVAYSGYKFVGIIVSVTLGEIFSGGKGTGGWAGWLVFIYAFLANAFFLVSTPTSKLEPRN